MGADRPPMMAPLAAGLLPLLLLATVGADGQPGPTIGANELQVVLDALLPRPLSVVFDGVNFTAPASNAPPAERGAPSSSASASSGGGCVSNDTVANVGCWGASDGGPAADKNVWGTGREVPQASTAEECCSLCANHSKCAAWTWNGPHGNLYCYGCECTRCPSAPHCASTTYRALSVSLKSQSLFGRRGLPEDPGNTQPWDADERLHEGSAAGPCARP